MEHTTHRVSAVLATIFAGVFTTLSAGAQEVPAAAPESAPAASAQVAPPDSAASAPPASAPAAPAASAQVAPVGNAQAAPAAGAPAAPNAVATTPAAGAPPPPAWEHSKPPAPVTSPRREYDGPPLVFGKRTSIGGYGGFTAAYTRMFNMDGALLGFEGALHIAHRLSLGLAGFGFSRTPQGPEDWDGTPRNYGAGYGGFVARYALFTSSPVYASVGAIIGGGAVVLHPDWESYDEDHDEDYDGEDADGFFVVQPELSLHANVTRWMRLGLALGYRATKGVNRLGLTESDLNGVVLGGNIQFGWI